MVQWRWLCSNVSQFHIQQDGWREGQFAPVQSWSRWSPVNGKESEQNDPIS